MIDPASSRISVSCDKKQVELGRWRIILVKMINNNDW